MLEASAFQALQAQAPYRGIIKPPVELVVHDLAKLKRTVHVVAMNQRIIAANDAALS